jgi:hypothetical protein
MRTLRLGVAISCCTFALACAGATVRPKVAASKPPSDALLVLPGFGYNHAGEQALRSLAPSMAAEAIDLYVPTFVSRSGLAQSRERLAAFIRANHLERYERVHVFAFIAGGWAFNPLAATDVLPNLSTVVYDRSPYQERAPRIALDKLRWLAWIKYGSVVFDVARTPYVPMTAPAVRIGLVVETEPTRFIQRFAETARGYGPYDFACEAFGQPFDDCLYASLNHDQLYTRFSEVWPDVLAFIRRGQFTDSAERTRPQANGQRSPAESAARGR